MNELTQNGAYPERTANGNLCRVILFKNFRCGLIRSVGVGGSKMARHTRWRRYKEQLTHRAQSLREGIICIGTRGITWGRCVVVSGRARVHTLWRWGLKISREAWGQRWRDESLVYPTAFN